MHFKTFFLICGLLTLQNFDTWAESILFSFSSGEKSSLTHTVFRGLDRHNNRISDLTSRVDSLNDLLPTGNLHEPYPWKYKIAATLFWAGEQATENNPVANTESAWDVSWLSHYGGEDDPAARTNFIPAGFTPGQNPFYVALPYNDVDDHHTKPEGTFSN
jgi:hypothetical protein